MKCEYISFSLYVNEDRITTDVLSVLGVFRSGGSEMRNGLTNMCDRPTESMYPRQDNILASR